MFRFVNLIDLTNKYIFFLVIFSIVFILTYINKLSFYEYVKIRNYQEIRFIAKGIHLDINKCKNQKDTCLEEISTNINKLKPYVNIIISDSNDVLLDYKNVKERHKNRTLVSIPKYLQKIERFDLNLAITKESIPNIFNATFKSITFSLFDIYKKYKEIGLKKALIWYLDQKIFLRSENVIVFFFLTYLIIYLVKQEQLQSKNKMNSYNIKIVNLSRNIEEKENELSKLIKDLNSKNIDFTSKITKHRDLMHPSFDASNYKELLELDPEVIIYKSRKVLERTVSLVYKKQFEKVRCPNLAKMLEELKTEKVFSKKMYSYADTIRAFGNIAAHPDFENKCMFERNDATMIATALVLFIEEVQNQKLC